MRKKLISGTILTLAAAIGFISCNKTEDFQTAQTSDFLPMIPGKYITYRVDSTVFTSFGETEETHRYQVKHEVDAEVTDNLGRPSFRVFRYINDSIASGPWVPDGSYFVTLLQDQAELINDNQRVVVLHLPIRNGNSWKGNKHLPDNPFGSLYTFSNDETMGDWDFYFNGDKESSVTIEGQVYEDVYTVMQVDESFNVPITDPLAYAAINYGEEKYAEDLGLVYRNFIMWEYQPNFGGTPYRIGFGIRMWMVDHN